MKPFLLRGEIEGRLGIRSSAIPHARSSRQETRRIAAKAFLGYGPYVGDVSAETFIEPESLLAVQGGTLFYPSAGSDYGDFLTLFHPYLESFVFADLYYNFSSNLNRFRRWSDCGLIESQIVGNAKARVERRRTDSGRTYRFVEPAYLIDVYASSKTKRRFSVTFRRGFGQYALREFAPESVNVFVHRGDSTGEGGSNVFYLSNKWSHIEPCGFLFDKLSTKLVRNAIVISDGSNTQIPFLKERFGATGAEAYQFLRSETFYFADRSFRCAGYLRSRYQPTLVWAVEQR